MFKKFKVIELASVLAGPSVGMFFAELGATVLKVENPKTNGDVTRSWKLKSESKENDVTAYFSSVNWGKKSIGIDFSKKEGQEIIYDLVKDADLVISSFKPKDDVKFNLDYSTLSKINPKLIYAQITGFGLDSDKTGYDAIVQAATGFMFMNGEKGSIPTKMPVALMDVLSSHQLKEAVLLAIIQRMQTGKGSFVTTSLYNTGLASLVNQATNWLVGKKVPQRIGSEHPNIVPYGSIFITKDKKEIVLAIGNDRQFQAICKILGNSNLAFEEKFKHNFNRVQNRKETQNELAKLISNFERDFLINELDKNQIPASGIFDLKEVFEQELSQKMILKSDEILGVRSVAFDGIEKVREIAKPPHFNEHSKEILEEVLNYPKEKISELEKLKII
ncbi:MAG: CoA transferase [Calditrichaeota bacterium]|nr:MAG: CoA transferase [Calditrichota bacterium]